MSVRLMVEVLDHAPRDLPDAHHRALLAMAEKMDDRTRRGWHPRAELAHRISRSERSTRRVLSDLVDHGLLTVVKKAGRGQSTLYYLAPLAPVDGGPLSADDPEKEDTQGDPLSQEDTPEKGDTQDGPLSEEKEDTQGDPLSPEKGAKRGPSETKRGPNQPQKGDTQGGPPSLHPLSIPSSPRAHTNGSSSPTAPTDDDDDDLRSIENDPAATAAMVTLREHTPRPITPEHAHRVARTILAGRTVTDPAAYVRRAVSADPDRHIPAAVPPRTAAVLAHPEAPEAAPTSTRDRPAHVTETLAALRAQWGQPTTGGAA